MPDRDRFDSAADYYATALHELVAELGSIYCMSALGLHGEIAGHASYLDHWLSVLKEDKSAIFRAAAQAEVAYQWLIGQLQAPSVGTAA